MDLMRQPEYLSFVHESAMKKTPGRDNPRFPVMAFQQYLVAIIVTDGVTLGYRGRLPATR